MPESTRSTALKVIAALAFVILPLFWFDLWSFPVLVDERFSLAPGELRVLVVSEDATPASACGHVAANEPVLIRSNALNESPQLGPFCLDGPLRSLAFRAGASPAWISVRVMSLESATKIGAIGAALTLLLLVLLGSAIALVMRVFDHWPPMRYRRPMPSMFWPMLGIGVASIAYAALEARTALFPIELDALTGACKSTDLWSILAQVWFPVAAVGLFLLREGRTFTGGEIRFVRGVRFILLALSLFAFQYAVAQMVFWAQRTFTPSVSSLPVVSGGLVPIGSLRQLPLIVLIAFSAGVCEELVFRGFLLSRLHELTGSAVTALIVSSLGFALFHHDYGWVHAAGTGVSAFGWGAVTLRWRSIYPAMWAHCATDLVRAIYGANALLWGLAG